eukprot:scaffold4510_cov183-Amphora_coffeaeformis.AAC.69
MHFIGKQLLAKRYEPWADYYLDYTSLKNILEQKPDKKSSSNTSLSSMMGSSSSRHDRSKVSQEFHITLNVQVERIVHFFLQQQGSLSSRLINDLEPQLQSLNNGKEFSVYNDLYCQYQQCAQSLFALVQFVALNVTGLRKILKKHDKITGLSLSKDYLRDSTGNIKSRSVIVKPLLEDGGLEALFVKLKVAFARMSEVLPDVLQSDKKSTNNVSSLFRWNTWSEDSGHGRSPEDTTSSLLSLVGPSSLEEQRYASTSHSERLRVRQDDVLLYYSSHEVVLLQIQAARALLQESSDFVNMLAASALLEATNYQSNDNVVPETTGSSSDRRRQISNYLNFCSTFLHMTDYYIVAPSCGVLSERLGEGAALAGLIIGLNSCAALVSTILYSWWTTYSYKSALIFASVCQMLGCLIYASALPMNSLALVILGRLIGGFGSARSINRRYIADTYPLHQRTAASAGFVTAGALGTSTGPALAALLYLTMPTGSENLMWQVENSPGWTMAILWGIYILGLIFYFEEPHRKPQRNKSELELPTSGEKEHLLNTNNNAASVNVKSDPPLWKIVPVSTTFFVYFTLKFILESLLSSTAILTDYYFAWSGSASGIYLAILGLLVLPANWIITVASQRHDDRDLILASASFMFLGCVVILQFRGT